MIDWHALFGAVVRRKWILIGGIALGVASGLYFERGVDPSYHASSTLWIDGGGGPDDDAGPLRPAMLFDPTGWVDLAGSYAVLDPVVERLGLHVRPSQPSQRRLFEGFPATDALRPGRYELRFDQPAQEWVLLDHRGAELERAPLGGELGASLGADWTPDPDAARPGLRAAFSLTRPREAAQRLERELEVRIQGAFLTIGLRGTEPARVTQIVNGVSERYLEVAAELKRAKLEELSSILEEQVDYAAGTLRDAEVSLEDFRVRTVSRPATEGSPIASGVAQTRDPVFENFQRLRIRAEELRRDRAALERALERSGEGGRLAVEALEAIPSAQESSELMQALAAVTTTRGELRDLELVYTRDHPDVRRTLDEIRVLERTTVPSLVAATIEEVDERRRALEGFAEQVAAELRELPAQSAEETRLERQFASAETLFNQLQGRYESARLGAASTIPDVRVLDFARVPEEPSSDPRTRVRMLAMLAGLGLGLWGAVLRDRFDRRVRSADEVTAGLGLSILGTIPRARMRGGKLVEEDRESSVEAFRSLRVAVANAHGGDGPLICTVTSPGVGDGKSFTTSNLALAFAELGRRTLVVDGDVRRGTIHTLFGVDRRPGLTDHLAGSIHLQEAVRGTEHPYLDVMPSGARLRDAPELLGQRGMEDLFDELKAEYEVILVDTSPVGATSDAFVLGALSGAMVLVLRAGTTDRVMARTRIGDLQKLPARLLGAVLNDVPSSGSYRYYGYLPGYAAGGEETTAPHEPALAATSSDSRSTA